MSPSSGQGRSWHLIDVTNRQISKCMQRTLPFLDDALTAAARNEYVLVGIVNVQNFKRENFKSG